jgi:glycosyltransferase involved in cell wall biosynthesis
MNHNHLLIFFHCGSNTGYAIENLEHVFFKMALNFSGSAEKIHLGYKDLCNGRPQYLPDDFHNIIQINTRDSSKEHLQQIYEYIQRNQIRVAFGFDQPVSAPGFMALRKGGVKLFVSYWGAPMSSLNSGIKLLLKRIEVYFRRNKPDHFIFESQAMAARAISGRGVCASNVSIIPTGVDANLFKPANSSDDYAHRAFGIPSDRNILLYTGHMEERKGVRVIIEAANKLVLEHKRKDLHFLLIGNRPGEEERFFPLFKGRKTEKHVTFGGYRRDIKLILPSCTAGIIASTGWDSFPMYALETAACGIPLLGSNLEGIKETIDHGVTGFLFTPGNPVELAEKILLLLNDSSRCRAMGAASRDRVVHGFSTEIQVERLTALLTRLFVKVK